MSKYEIEQMGEVAKLLASLIEALDLQVVIVTEDEWPLEHPDFETYEIRKQ